MISPITTRNYILLNERTVFEYRKDSFEVTFYFYKDKDTGEQWTTTESDGLVLTQVHNKYREKYGIPFTDEIKSIRNKYGLSAAKMSEVLGLGANVYRNYEAGEVPSVATGHLIRMAENPAEFLKLLEMSKNVLEQKEYDKVKKKVLQAADDMDAADQYGWSVLFDYKNPNMMNGFKTPDIKKIADMVFFFAKHNAPFTTALNKLMFYADFGHYKKHGYSISGICYKAIQKGPVPENYGGIYNYVINTGLVSVEEMAFGEYVGERFVANDNAKPTSFSEEESSTMKKVSEKFKGLSTKQIVDLSHDEPAWKNNVDAHNRISFDYGFELKNID